jgi:lysozyme
MQQITITQDTLAKPKPRPSKELLAEGCKLPTIKKGTVLPVKAIRNTVESGHIYITLGELDGHQLTYAGLNSIYVYLGHTDSTVGVRSVSSAPSDGSRSLIGNYRISAKGLELLKAFEGCELTAYDDGVGVCTIGYGTTKGVNYGMCITQEKAEQLLQDDLIEFEKGVQELVKVPLSQNEFDAIVVFAYNIGLGGLEESTFLTQLNGGDYIGPLSQFLRWNKGGGRELAGLTRRRNAEAHLFATGQVKTDF